MIKVVVADDFSAMLKIMKQLIERAGEMELAGDATRADEVIALLEHARPDVIVMNDYVPPLGSIQVIEMVRAAGFQQPILVVSMHNDSDLAHAALQKGAAGFMLKPELLDQFIPAIRAVHRGETFLSPQITITLKGD